MEEAHAGIKIAKRNINNLRCRGPALVGSRDSLRRTALAKRIAQQRVQRLDMTGLHGKLIKFVTPNLL